MNNLKMSWKYIDTKKTFANIHIFLSDPRLDAMYACYTEDEAMRLCREFNNREDTPFFRAASEAILKWELDQHEMENLLQETIQGEKRC